MAVNKASIRFLTVPLFLLLISLNPSSAFCGSYIEEYAGVCRSMELFKVGLITDIDKGLTDQFVVVTLGSAWYELTKPQQEDVALSLWQGWAKIRSPDHLDGAFIKFRSPMGRDLGGSSIFGSRIKLKE